MFLLVGGGERGVRSYSCSPCFLVVWRDPSFASKWKPCLKLSEEIRFIGAVGCNYCMTTQIQESGGWRLLSADSRAQAAPPHRAERPPGFSGSRCAIVLTFHSSSPLVSSVPVNINYYIILLLLLFCVFFFLLLSIWCVISSRATSQRV